MARFVIGRRLKVLKKLAYFFIIIIGIVYNKNYKAM